MPVRSSPHAPRHSCQVAACVFGVTASLLIGDAALAQQQKWAPSISFEGRPGTKRNLGEGDLFAPLLQSSTSMLFGNVRGRFDDDDYFEGNFGLGVRHMTGSWNLGLYGYYDRKRSSLGNNFNQATFGIEALGRDIDFRANAYLPFGDRVKDAGSTPGAGSFASLIGTTIQVTTLGAITRQERALTGFDAEVGWRVPLWSADDSKALRLYAGVFHFDDSVVKAITGPRLRAELTMYEVPYLSEGARLTLGAEYQHDDVRGSQGFGLVRLAIPLQAPGKAVRLSAQERRMTDRVVRDVDIVTQATATQAPSIVETATATAGGQAITVINASGTSGTDLPNAVSAAGNNSLVVLAGTFNTTDATTLQTGQTVLGATTLTVQTASGRTATWTAPGATVNRTSTTTGQPAFEMANSSTLSGMTINVTGNNSAVGVSANTLTNVTISNNTISVTAASNNVSAITLVNSTATVTGNNLNAVSVPGQYASSIFMNDGTYTIAGNTVNASGGNVSRNLNLQNNITLNAGSTGNTLSGGACYSSGVIVGTISFTNAADCP